MRTKKCLSCIPTNKKVAKTSKKRASWKQHIGLKTIFPNIKQIGTVDKIVKLKKSGKGNRTIVVFNLDGGRIRAICTQWDKSEKYASGLSVVLDSENYINWLNNKAYK